MQNENEEQPAEFVENNSIPVPQDSVHIDENEDSIGISEATKAETEARELDSRSVYVANVDYAATPQSLEEIFLKVGTVQKVTIVVHRHTGFPKGHAYVAFKDKASVARAIEELNDTDLRGRPLKVHEKKTITRDEKRQSRDFHGSRGGSSRGRGRGRGRGSGREIGKEGRESSGREETIVNP